MDNSFINREVGTKVNGRIIKWKDMVLFTILMDQ